MCILTVWSPKEQLATLFWEYRCGQRWVKLCKAVGKDVRASSGDGRGRPVGQKAAGGAAPTIGATPAASTGGGGAIKRIRAGYESGMSKISGAVPQRSRYRSFLSETTSDNSDTAGVDSPRAVGAAVPGLGVPVHAQERRVVHRGGPTSAFCVQKVASGKVSYALFWVVDTAGGCILAAVVSGFISVDAKKQNIAKRPLGLNRIPSENLLPLLLQHYFAGRGSTQFWSLHLHARSIVSRTGPPTSLHESI